MSLFETERLIIRPFGPSDLPHYIALNVDPEVRRYLGGVLTPEEAAEEMADIADLFERRGYGMVPVIRRSDGAFLGTCGLSVESWYPDDLGLGWRFLPEHWGHGYATEAAMVWRDHAFEALDAPRLISIAYVPNIRSHRVMERLGMSFDHDAELVDGDETFAARIYALTASTWRALSG